MSVFAVDKLSERQKIAITYLCSYGIAYGDSISERILLPMMTVVLFLIQEFFRQIRKRLRYCVRFTINLWILYLWGCFNKKYGLFIWRYW